MALHAYQDQAVAAWNEISECRCSVSCVTVSSDDSHRCVQAGGADKLFALRFRLSTIVWIFSYPDIGAKSRYSDFRISINNTTAFDCITLKYIRINTLGN